MLRGRQVWTVLMMVWGAWIVPTFVLRDLLGLDGTGVTITVAVFAVLGLLLGLDEARTVEPFSPRDRRDVIVGVIALVGAVAVCGCFVTAPAPLNFVGAALLCAATVRALRHVH